MLCVIRTAMGIGEMARYLSIDSRLSVLYLIKRECHMFSSSSRSHPDTLEQGGLWTLKDPRCHNTSAFTTFLERLINSVNHLKRETRTYW